MMRFNAWAAFIRGLTVLRFIGGVKIFTLSRNFRVPSAALLQSNQTANFQASPTLSLAVRQSSAIKIGVRTSSVPRPITR